MEQEESAELGPVAKVVIFLVCVTLGSAVASFALNYYAPKPVAEQKAPEHWCAGGNSITTYRSTMIIMRDAPECAATAPEEDEEDSGQSDYITVPREKRGNSA